MVTSPLSGFLELLSKDQSPEEVQTFITDYYDYQVQTRFYSVKKYPLLIAALGDGRPATNPYGAFLQFHGIGSKTFAKAFCVPSGNLNRISRGVSPTIPKNVLKALSVLPNGLDFCEEWQERHRDYYHYCDTRGKF